MRTATNLEGDTVPTDQESLLLENYRKERADYEKRQLQTMAELKAKREGSPSQAPGSLGGGAAMYEDVYPTSMNAHRAQAQEEQSEINPYQFPVDAVPHTPGKVGMVKRSSPKKLTMGTGVLTVGEDYTVVFNTLPKGHTVQKIPPVHPQPRTRSLSDSSQPSAATVAYENSPLTPSPLKDSPEQASKPSSGSGGEGAGVGERKDSNRLSKRKLAKEVVEFDPNKQRKFRMTSDIKKKTDRKSADFSNQVDGGSLESSQNGADRPFSIHTEEQGLSYAMVNMEDKKKYRLEVNATKREGSGNPQHYRVPIASS